MKPCRSRVIGNHNFRIRQGRQLLHSFRVSCSHVRSRNNSETSAVLSKLFQLVYNEPKPAPLYKRDKHVYSVAGLNLRFQLAEKRRLLLRARKERALGKRSLWTWYLIIRVQSIDAVLALYTGCQLFRRDIELKGRKILRAALLGNGGNNFIGKVYPCLSIIIGAVNIGKSSPQNFAQILGQDNRGLRTVKIFGSHNCIGKRS